VAEMGNLYPILVTELEGKRLLGRTGFDESKY
jgi:hypothetical protein